MRVGRFLVQGVDVWLNNPRRPLEASGTSGMKAAQNGVPSVSVLDGWWDEGFSGDNGWAIGGRETNPDEAAQDWSDAQDLYRLLEEEIIPSYYDRDRNGLPTAWIATMRQAMATTLWTLLDDADAPRVHRAALPAGRGRHRPGEGEDAGRHGGRLGPPWRPASRWRSPSTTTSRSATSAGSSPRTASTAYLPMLEALDRHPGVHLSLHYTGPLLEWFAAERPDFIDRLRALVARGQVEILGGGYYEPVLASLPERDRIGQLRPDGRRARGDLRPSAARRVARGARLGAGPADLARRRRLRVDDPRRCPLPRRGHPRGGPVGAVHDRGPGPPGRCLRDRAGAALPDPVPRCRGRHRLPARPRDRGRLAGRDDGRRRREVRRRGRPPGSTAGASGAGSNASSPRSKRTPTGSPRSRRPLGWTATVRSGACTSRPGRTRRWASGRYRPTESRRVRCPVPPGPGRAPARGTLAARRVLAQLPGQVPRDQRPPQADAPGLRQGRGDAARPGPRPGPRPPLPRPVERLLLARTVRRHLHQPHAARHVRAPDRGRGHRRHRAGAARRRDGRPIGRGLGPRQGRLRRGPAGRTRAGRDDRSRGGRRDRVVGPAGDAACGARRCSAAGRRRTTRSSVRSRHRAADGGRRGTSTRRRPRSTTSSGDRARTRRPAAVRRPRATIGPGPIPPTRTRRRTTGRTSR